MGDLFSNLGLGFGVVFQIMQWSPAFLGGISIPIPVNILLCLIGALVGTLVGVLPGIGTVATVAMLLPITFGLPPVGALIMLAGIYYGAQYGGSTTSILVNIPGEASSVVTTLDGHQMAKQGRAGPALAIAAIGSFFAGCVATVLIAVLGAPLTRLALAFGPAEYFSLMVLGLIFAVVLAKGSVLKAIAMIVFGLLLSMVGSDIETGASRMTFNIPELADGLGFATVAMGVFGFAEIIRNLDAGGESDRELVQQKVTGLMPTKKDLKRFRAGDPARHDAGIDPRHSAGRRRRDRFVRGLYAREEARQGSVAVRPRRDRGRGGTGKRQQRGRADLVHSAADARHSAERGDGADGRRHDHSRHRAGTAGDAEAARPGVGHDRLDVDRQPDADHHQPAAGRHLGAAAAGAVPADVSVDRDFLRDRHLLDQQRSRPTSFSPAPSGSSATG